MNGKYLRLGDTFTLRPGFQLQIWAQMAQDSAHKPDGSSGDFAENIYIRRGRLFFGGEIGTPRLTYFVLWEAANDGLATGGSTATPAVSKFTPFQLTDAYLDFKLNDHLSVQAGLFLPPLTRNIIQSTTSYWSIDIGGVSATNIAATQTLTLRDAGIEAKVYGANDHLEVRGMVSQGVRQPDTTPGGTRAPGKNEPRLTGFVQYNFLDVDLGSPYVYGGQYFGRKTIAAIALGGDYQKLDGSDNPYFATSATAVAAIPIHGADPKNGGDEVGGQVELLHFHNGAIPGNTLGKQDDLFIEGGYYNKAAHMSVFGKFEGRFFGHDDFMAPNVRADTGDTRVYGAGLKYFVAEAFANITLQYSVTQTPNIPTTMRNSTNLLQLQLQLAYF